MIDFERFRKYNYVVNKKLLFRRKNVSWRKIFQNIEHNRNNTAADNLVSYTSDDVHLTIDHNLNVTVEGEDIDEKSIITTLKEVITDSKLIDRIAEALIKRDNRIKRMRG